MMVCHLCNVNIKNLFCKLGILKLGQLRQSLEVFRIAKVAFTSNFNNRHGGLFYMLDLLYPRGVYLLPQVLTNWGEGIISIIVVLFSTGWNYSNIDIRPRKAQFCCVGPIHLNFTPRNSFLDNFGDLLN